tara:strand:+ start:6482 stop:7657 length:1176 start_codon:yes stop_codon:yes gene_type:complete
MIISAVPDHITITSKEFVSHFYNLFTTEKYNFYEEHHDFVRIYGYSCRTLFEMCMIYFKSINKTNLTTTGLQHTSFKNIITKYVDEDNLHIFDYSNNITKIKEQEITTDLVLFTHLFGQDFDLSSFKKEKYNDIIIIEDRVQGGTLNKNFSDDIIDISLYSMGMDKKPNSLGGGFINIRNTDKNKPLINYLINKTKTLKQETKLDRLYNLIKKIPTFLIYNFKLLSYVLIYIISVLNYFNSNINTTIIISNYRNTNPGFSHSNYMKMPSNSLLKSIKENINNYLDIEKIQSSKNNTYMNILSDTIKTNNYPWYKGNDLLTNYNTIYISSSKMNHFINICNNNNICIIINPTYKPLSKKHELLSKSLIYIPCLNTLTNEEMIFLSNILKLYA